MDSKRALIPAVVLSMVSNEYVALESSIIKSPANLSVGEMGSIFFHLQN